MALGSGESKQIGGGVTDDSGRSVVKLAKSATAFASSALVGATPVQIAPAADSRVAISLQPGDAAFVGISPTMNASVAAIANVASGAMFEERDYNGALYVFSAATQTVKAWDVRLP